MTAHGQCRGVSTDYVQLTHAVRSIGRNGNTLMETQHVNDRKYSAHAAMHTPGMTFQVSNTEQSLA